MFIDGEINADFKVMIKQMFDLVLSTHILKLQRKQGLSSPLLTPLIR